MHNEKQWALAHRFEKFLDETLYPRRFPDWTRERIKEKNKQRTCGDVRFSQNGHVIYIEEKAFASMWDGCLIELIQDIETKDMGWFYDLIECHYLICGYYDGPEKISPAIVHKLKWNALRERYIYLCRSKKVPSHFVSRTGYGLTLFAIVAWEDLKEIDEIIWPTKAEANPKRVDQFREMANVGWEKA